MTEIFIKNKYTKWYFNIIKARKSRVILKEEIYERHHILPKSIFPQYTNLEDYPWNKIYLTLKEHFIVHCLLVKMVHGDNQRKMLQALNLMGNSDKNITNSKLYKYFRGKFINSLTGIPKSEEHKQLQRKLYTEERRKRNSERTKRQSTKLWASYTPEQRQARIEACHKNKKYPKGKEHYLYGKQLSSYEKEQISINTKIGMNNDETKNKMKERDELRKTRKVCCINCHKELCSFNIGQHQRSSKCVNIRLEKRG